VEVNHTLIVPEFDPDLQPIGYTLALEFLGEGGYADSGQERVLTTSAHRVDQAGVRPLILGDGTGLPAELSAELSAHVRGVVEAPDI